MKDIDTIMDYEVVKKEGSSKPKVSLTFELSRSQIFSLQKAQVSVDELVREEIKPKKVEKEEEADSEKEDFVDDTDNDEEKTEKEEAETIEELETLKRTFYSTQRQVDKAISMAASTLQKFNNYMTDSADQELGDNHSIVDVIKSVERCSELIIEKLTISERALEEKNVMLLELLGGDMI